MFIMAQGQVSAGGASRRAPVAMQAIFLIEFQYQRWWWICHQSGNLAFLVGHSNMVPFLFCSFGNILGFSSFGYCCDFCPTRSVLFVPWYLRYSVSGELSIIDCVAFRKSQNLSPICFYTSERVSWRELALWWCYGQSVVMHCSWLSGMQEAAIVLRGKNHCRQLLVKASGRPWLLASWLHLFYKYGGTSDSSWKMCIVEKKLQGSQNCIKIF